MSDKYPNDVRTIANRRNSLKSTGPKDTSATRFNAVKHGLLSKGVLMVGEKNKELLELGKRLRTELSPDSELECILVDRIVTSVWRLKRAIRIETDYVHSEFLDCKNSAFSSGEKSDPKAWNAVVARELGHSNSWLNLCRYETMLEKQIYKALHELQRLQAARNGEKPPIPVAIDVDITTQD